MEVVNRAMFEFERETQRWKEKYKPVFGTEVKSGKDRFRFVSCNDLGVPYFRKIDKDGNFIGNMFYTVDGYDVKWAEKLLSKENHNENQSN